MILKHSSRVSTMGYTHRKPDYFITNFLKFSTNLRIKVQKVSKTQTTYDNFCFQDVSLLS